MFGITGNDYLVIREMIIFTPDSPALPCSSSERRGEVRYGEVLYVRTKPPSLRTYSSGFSEISAVSTLTSDVIWVLLAISLWHKINRYNAPCCASRTVPHCAVLFLNVLYCTTLHCTTLHCTILYCTTQHYTVLHCTALHCTVLYYTTLHCTILHYTALYYTTLQYTILHCTALYYTTLHCTAHFTARLGSRRD